MPEKSFNPELFAAAAPPSPEQPQLETPETEAETIRREFEYRGADGRLIGRATAEFAAEPVSTGHFSRDSKHRVPGQKLKSFVLHGERDGQSTELDLLELANPHDVNIVVANQPLDNYSYTDAKNQVTAPPLDSPLAIGTLLHELGHAEQSHDSAIKNIIDKSQPADFIESLPPPQPGSALDWAKSFRSTIKAVPQIREMCDPTKIEAVESLVSRLLQLNLDFSETLRRTYSADAETRKKLEVDGLGINQERTATEMKLLEELADVNAFNLIKLPYRWAERDATRRALRYLRSVRDQTGIDFFVPVSRDDDETRAPKDGCTDSVDVALHENDEWPPPTSILQDLKESLATYGAEKPTPRKNQA